VSDYELEDRAIEVRSLTEAEDFSSSPCVQTGSGAHPASYPMGTGGPFPGGKARPGRDADHSPASSVEVKNEQELYLFSPHAPPWRIAGSLYLYLLYNNFLQLILSLNSDRVRTTLVHCLPGGKPWEMPNSLAAVTTHRARGYRCSVCCAS
jgi:hypothetical protein